VSVFLELAYLFFIGCAAGWGMEVLFRRFNPIAKNTRKWVNPGFLVGPYLPIYGFGLVTGFTIFTLLGPYMKKGILMMVIVILLVVILMTIIEYIAGKIFILGMNIKLWDYSNMKGNIQGIICPQFSLIWAGAAVIYYFLIHPYMLRAVRWLSENLAFSFVIGFFYGVFMLDCVYSFRVVARVRAYARETGITVLYSEFKENIDEYKALKSMKPKFFMKLSNEASLRDYLENYFRDPEKYKENLEKRLEQYSEDSEVYKKLRKEYLERQKDNLEAVVDAVGDKLGVSEKLEKTGDKLEEVGDKLKEAVDKLEEAVKRPEEAVDKLEEAVKRPEEADDKPGDT
jgi:uncharacterized membrane protein